MSAAKLSEYSGAPSKRTLQYWKSHAGNPLEADLTRKLAPDQLKIISGFIFFCAESHQGCTVMDIQNFVQTKFFARHSLSCSFLSMCTSLASLHSNLPHSRSHLVVSIQQNLQLISYIQTNQYSQLKISSRVVALDQISIWDCGVITSSYSLIG